MAIFNEDLSGLTYQDLVNYKNNLKNSLPNVNMTQNTQSQIGNQARQDLVNFSNDVGGQVQNKFVSGLGYVADKGLSAGENLFNTLDKVGGFVGLGSTGQAEKYTQARQDVKNILPYYMDQMSLSKQQNVVTTPQGTSGPQRLFQENQFNNPTGDTQKEVNMLMNNVNTGYDPTAVTDLIRKQNQNRANALSSAVNTIPSNQQPNAFDLYKQNLNTLNSQRQTNQAPQFNQTQQDLMYYDALDRKNEAKRQNDWADFMMSRSAKAKTKSGAANYANLAGIGLNQTQNTRASGDAINQLRNQFNQQVGMANLNQNFNQQNQAYNSMSDMEKLRLQNSLSNDSAMRDFNNRLTLLDKETQLKLQDPTSQQNQMILDLYKSNPEILKQKLVGAKEQTDLNKLTRTVRNADGSETLIDLRTNQPINIQQNSLGKIEVIDGKQYLVRPNGTKELIK